MTLSESQTMTSPTRIESVSDTVRPLDKNNSIPTEADAAAASITKKTPLIQENASVIFEEDNEENSGMNSSHQDQSATSSITDSPSQAANEGGIIYEFNTSIASNQSFLSPISTSTISHANSAASSAIKHIQFQTPTNQQQPTNTSTPTKAPASAPPTYTTSLSSLTNRTSMSISEQITQEESLLQVLISKKRSLQSEIGCLLTLRERLVQESAESCARGVPFDYATRFAASPIILEQLENIANVWREERAKEQDQKRREERANLKQQLRQQTQSAAVDINHRPSTAPAASTVAAAPVPPTIMKQQPSAKYFAIMESPNLTPINTPSRERTQEKQRAIAASSEQPRAVKRTIFPSNPTPTTNDRSYVAPSSRPITSSEQFSSPIHQDEIESYIQAEESIYIDSIDGVENPLLEQPILTAATHPHHYQPSPVRRLPPPTRPHTTSAGRNYSHPPPRNMQQQYQQQSQFSNQQPVQRQRPQTAGPTRPRSVEFSSPSPAAAPSVASPSIDTSTPTSSLMQPHPGVSYCTRKVRLQEYEKEVLSTFEGQSLGAFAKKAHQHEREKMYSKTHYTNFTPKEKYEGNFSSATKTMTSGNSTSDMISSSSNPTSTSAAAATPGRTRTTISHTSSSNVRSKTPAGGKSHLPPSTTIDQTTSPAVNKIVWN